MPLPVLSSSRVWFSTTGYRAAAQDYPDKAIRILVAAAPGGPSTARTAHIADPATQVRPAGRGRKSRGRSGGTIGACAVAGAPPDGYTLLAGNTSLLAVQPSVSASAGFDPIKSFAPVAKISESFLILVVNLSSPWKSVKDLVDHAKANPGKLNYGHTGHGALPHLASERSRLCTGVEIVGVPYHSGAETVTGVMN